MDERKKRDEEEFARLVNPFPTGVNEVRVHLPEELFEEAAGTYVVDRSGQDPNDRVKLSKLGESKKLKQAVQPSGANSRQASPDVSAPSIVPASQLQLHVSPSQHVRTLGIWRARTPFAAALQNGTLHEKNPVRDYSWAVILGLASLGCMAAGAAHGNVALILVGLFLATAALYLCCRAEESDPKKSSATSLSIGLGLSQPTLL